MKKIRIFVALLIVVSIMATGAIASAEALGEEPNDAKLCFHTYEFVIEQQYLGDTNGLCKINIIELKVCTKCGHEIVLSEYTIFADHVSFILKASCDRATHIYYCKCKCGKGMPTIREACPRPGLGCPEILSLGRRIGRIDMPY